MILGLNDKNELIMPSRGVSAKCPCCGGSLIPRCGEIVRWHWAHESMIDCDEWHEPESEWHISWKGFVADFDPTLVEVVIDEYGTKHRADIRRRDGVVIELQHSSISVGEIEEREWFYGDMFWIFDARDARKKNRFKIFDRTNSDGIMYQTYRWKHPRKSIEFCGKEVFLDLGDCIFELKTFNTKTSTGGWGLVHDRDEFIGDFIESALDL